MTNYYVTLYCTVIHVHIHWISDIIRNRHFRPHIKCLLTYTPISYWSSAGPRKNAVTLNELLIKYGSSLFHKIQSPTHCLNLLRMWQSSNSTTLDTFGVFDIRRIVWNFSLECEQSKNVPFIAQNSNWCACAQLVLGHSWQFDLLQLTN